MENKYVVGFYFDASMDNVVLIKKLKPEWQKGLLNGLGGKIEEGELPSHAMTREFKEECGVDVYGWNYIATMFGNGWSVEVFYARDKYNENFFSVKQQEEEEILVACVANIHEYNVVSNLRWLIPICVDHCLYENTEYKTNIQF